MDYISIIKTESAAFAAKLIVCAKQPICTYTIPFRTVDEQAFVIFFALSVVICNL